MKFVIKEIDALKIIGLKIKTTLQENAEPLLWENFNQRSAEVSAKIIFYAGVFPYFEMSDFGDFEDHTEFEYIAGVAVNEFTKLPEGMIKHTIPASKYAVFTHKGSLDNLENTYKYIFRVWKNETDLIIKKTDQFELYDQRFSEDGINSEMDIYIPVE